MTQLRRRSVSIWMWVAAIAIATWMCIPAPAQTNDSPVRFRAVDIYVDSKDKPLAAYQLVFSIAGGGTRIAGIEGGDRPFSEPPFYDPKAMQQERVIIAAFSTNSVSALPKGKTRVATIHVQITRVTEPEFELKLQAAADADGKRIKADITAEERKK